MAALSTPLLTIDFHVALTARHLRNDQHPSKCSTKIWYCDTLTRMTIVTKKVEVLGQSTKRLSLLPTGEISLYAVWETVDIQVAFRSRMGFIAYLSSTYFYRDGFVV
ncbi:unnamed protein product [Ectocarpus sp. 13 AM-2016]